MWDGDQCANRRAEAEGPNPDVWFLQYPESLIGGQGVWNNDIARRVGGEWTLVGDTLVIRRDAGVRGHGNGLSRYNLRGFVEKIVSTIMARNQSRSISDDPPPLGKRISRGRLNFRRRRSAERPPTAAWGSIAAA